MLAWTNQIVEAIFVHLVFGTYCHYEHQSSRIKLYGLWRHRRYYVYKLSINTRYEIEKNVVNGKSCERLPANIFAYVSELEIVRVLKTYLLTGIIIQNVRAFSKKIYNMFHSQISYGITFLHNDEQRGQQEIITDRIFNKGPKSVQKSAKNSVKKKTKC